MLFDETIFDNREAVKQTEFFEYASITIPLLINTELTIEVWGRTVDYMNGVFDGGSLRNSDME